MSDTELLINQNLNLLVKALNQKKVKEEDTKYIEIILDLLNQELLLPKSENLPKLQLLKKLLSEMRFEKNVPNFLVSYQSILVLIQLPKEYIKIAQKTMDKFIKKLEQDNLMHISDEEKITLWIDHFILKNNSYGFTTRKIQKLD